MGWDVQKKIITMGFLDSHGAASIFKKIKLISVDFLESCFWDKFPNIFHQPNHPEIVSHVWGDESLILPWKWQYLPRYKRPTQKKPPTFHWILVVKKRDPYLGNNPHIAGWYNPLYTLDNQGPFFHCSNGNGPLSQELLGNPQQKLSSMVIGSLVLFLRLLTVTHLYSIYFFGGDIAALGWYLDF